MGQSERGWIDAVLDALRSDPAFLAQMKAIVLKQVRLFRESPVVARQTEFWKRQRLGTVTSE